MRVGAYQRDGSDNDSLESDRGLFLVAARSLDLRIMIDLMFGPFRLYVELLSQCALDNSSGRLTWEQFLAFLPDWKAIESEAKTAEAGSTLLAFRKALFDWSVRWHLNADWCRDRAIGAMRLWGSSERARLYLCWDPLDFWGRIQERLKIYDQLCDDERDNLRSWESDPALRSDLRPAAAKIARNAARSIDRKVTAPDLFDASFPRPPENLPRFLSILDRKSYLEAVRKFRENELAHLSGAAKRRIINARLRSAKRYLDQVDRWFKARGWKPRRRQPEHVTQFHWAALYQILGVERRHIAASAPMVQIETVSQAISKVLSHLGLPSRRRRRPARANP